jgi:hypothetical protein
MVGQPGRARCRLQQVAAGGVEGAYLSFHGEPAGRREVGDHEALLAAAGDGAGLPVGRLTGRGLDGARDSVVPQAGMLPKSARNAKTSLVGRAIVTVFWNVAILVVSGC